MSPAFQTLRLRVFMIIERIKYRSAKQDFVFLHEIYLPRLDFKFLGS